MADNRNKLSYEFLKQRSECGRVFLAREDCEDYRKDIWDFARSRAHKGLVVLVVGLLGVLVSVGAGQFYWTQRLHGRQQEKIHKLEIETSIQLKELQAKQEIILQEITDLREDVRVLSERITERR